LLFQTTANIVDVETAVKLYGAADTWKNAYNLFLVYIFFF